MTPLRTSAVPTTLPPGVVIRTWSPLRTPRRGGVVRVHRHRIVDMDAAQPVEPDRVAVHQHGLLRAQQHRPVALGVDGLRIGEPSAKRGSIHCAHAAMALAGDGAARGADLLVVDVERAREPGRHPVARRRPGRPAGSGRRA